VQDGYVTVIVDGEIHNPRSGNRSDAEVILENYLEYGRSFASHLQGVFACAIFDEYDLILARDPFGVRPLYWGSLEGGGICFASELKAFEGITDNVTDLPPGAVFTAQTGLAKYVPQWPSVNIPEGFDEAAELLRQLLVEAVARRLGDEAVGACLLSGGLDSSIIAAIATSLGVKLPMITVGIEGAPDLENAALMAEHLDAKHHVRLFSPDDIAGMVPQAVRTLESFDEDCVSGAISNLFGSELASEFTNCVLSGEGGDELFGGYHLLKDQPTEKARLHMMDRLLEIAHNTALQRLDRAMMGNSINYRTPFIDNQVFAFASQLPVDWKIHNCGNGRLVEKWILREAFRDYLPDEIYSREKLRFSGGTGVDTLMDIIAEGQCGELDGDVTQLLTAQGFHFSSPKEVWYYEIFKNYFPSPESLKLVARWDPFK
jgi:asparagine synthase (glutamine-hydrolysing)